MLIRVRRKLLFGRMVLRKYYKDVACDGIKYVGILLSSTSPLTASSVKSSLASTMGEDLPSLSSLSATSQGDHLPKGHRGLHLALQTGVRQRGCRARVCVLPR
jgi:hypothetical protein